MKSFSMTVSSVMVFPNNFGISDPLDSTPLPEIDVEKCTKDTYSSKYVMVYDILEKYIYE